MGHTTNYNLPYPDGTDPVVVHTDVQDLAQHVDTTLRAEAYYQGASPLQPTDNIDNLPTGIYTIWGGATAEGLELPEIVQGSLEVHRWGEAGGVAVFRTRNSPSHVWENARLSGGWAGWVRVDAGVIPVRPARLLPASPTMLKSVPLAFTIGYGGERTSGSGTTSVIQHLPASVLRVQVHMRNWNPRYINADRGPVTLTGVRIGRHTGNGNGTDWISLRSGATEYASQWVNVPNDWQGQEIVIEYSWSGSDVTLCLGTGWTDNASDQRPPLFVWAEVEVPATTPVVAAFGSSTAAGVGADRPLIDSWLAQWSRDNDAVPAFWANSGDSAANWVGDTDRKWELYGLHVNAPDAMLYAMGSNDWSSGASLSELQERITNNVDQIQQRITAPVYGTTITPRSTPGGGTDTVRTQLNSWMRTSGLFRGVFDFAAAVSLPDGSLDPAVDADGTHVTTEGHARLAQSINQPVTSTPLQVSELSPGVYEIGAH